jgi:uncharacterized protein
MQNERMWDRLRSLLAEMRLAVLAYSGGVDSSLLLRASSEVLGPNLLAVTASSDTYPPGEISLAKAYAATLGVRHRIIPSDELSLDDFVRNGPDRCYHCKRDLFGKLRALAEREGIPHILDGSNTDDLRDHRPGRRAAEELGVRSPLIEAGLAKQHVRDLARWLGMPLWDKPSLACLSSRVPYGTPITVDLLRTIHAAEEVVRRSGVRQVRVRHHGDTARIEVPVAEFSRLVAADAASAIVQGIKELGYIYVALDLAGYRTGSMNETLPAAVTGGEKDTDAEGVRMAAALDQNTGKESS